MFKSFSLNLATIQKIAIVGLFVVSVMAFGLAPEAHADSIPFTLSFANPDLFSQGAGPYAKGMISSVDSTGMLWSVTAIGSNGFVFGGKGAMALNINLDNTGEVKLLPSSCNMSPCTQDMPGNNDGFGNFTFKVNDGPGFSLGGYASVSFQFTTEKAVTSASNLLTANNNGVTISAHMALASNTGCTGFAANGAKNDATGPTTSAPCISTPEPSSLATGGIGLLGLLLLVGGRRLIKNT